MKKACRQDKNNYIVCQEKYTYCQKLYNNVRYLSREFKPQALIIMDENEKTKNDECGVADIWRSHCKKL